MKTAKVLWILGSILINVVIFFYIKIMSQVPVGTHGVRYEYINENWSQFEIMWKAEMIVMSFLTISAIFFAIKFKSVAWSIVAFGQLVLITLYPVMIGGYHGTSVEVYTMAYQMSVLIFVFGKMLFLAGIIFVYLTDSILQKWLRIVASLLALIGLIAFSASYFGFIDWKQALKFAIALNLLYLINAYHGFKMETNELDAKLEK